MHCPTIDSRSSESTLTRACSATRYAARSHRRVYRGCVSFSSTELKRLPRPSEPLLLPNNKRTSPGPLFVGPRGPHGQSRGIRRQSSEGPGRERAHDASEGAFSPFAKSSKTRLKPTATALHLHRQRLCAEALRDERGRVPHGLYAHGQVAWRMRYAIFQRWDAIAKEGSPEGEEVLQPAPFDFERSVRNHRPPLRTPPLRGTCGRRPRNEWVRVSPFPLSISPDRAPTPALVREGS